MRNVLRAFVACGIYVAQRARERENYIHRLEMLEMLLRRSATTRGAQHKVTNN